MSQIRLDLEGVEGVVRQIDAAIEELRTAASHIDSQMESQLGAYWEGAAYQKTMNTYEESYRRMLTKDLPEMVTNLSEYMTGCKEAIAETDRMLSGR